MTNIYHISSSRTASQWGRNLLYYVSLAYNLLPWPMRPLILTWSFDFRTWPWPSWPWLWTISRTGVNGVENSCNNFDLYHVSLTYNLLPWPMWPLIMTYSFDLRTWPWSSWPSLWTIFSDTRLKTRNFKCFKLMTLIFDLRPWTSILRYDGP